MLRPLEQWICDGCNELIENPEHGWLEWLSGSQLKQKDFRIVHHVTYSPRKPRGCYAYNNQNVPDGFVILDDYLTSFIGDEGLTRLLGFIDVGPFHQQHYSGPYLADLREWVELVRRLTTPYFEEARQYLTQANRDGMLEGLSEVAIYMPSFLGAVVDRYGTK